MCTIMTFHMLLVSLTDHDEKLPVSRTLCNPDVNIESCFFGRVEFWLCKKLPGLVE